MSDEPERISCLMVTRPSPERFELFKQSVACFQAQTYPNRELVIVLDQGPSECVKRIENHLAGLGVSATLAQPAPQHSVGALRNLSVQSASGSVLCPWDDDDLSHPTRLAEQYDLMIREGCHCSGPSRGSLPVSLVPGDVLDEFPQRAGPLRCEYGALSPRRLRTRYPEDRPRGHGNAHEDTALVLSLQAEGKFLYLAGAPYLFVYIYHGGNTCDSEHFQMLARSLGISRGLLERRRDVFKRLDCFSLGEGTITVMGNNGPAFQIPGRPGSAPLDA